MNRSSYAVEDVFRSDGLVYGAVSQRTARDLILLIAFYQVNKPRLEIDMEYALGIFTKMKSFQRLDRKQVRLVLESCHGFESCFYRVQIDNERVRVASTLE